MTIPTTPAPMTAERLNEIRAVHQSDWARELYIHIDALEAVLAAARGRMGILETRLHEALKEPKPPHAAYMQLREERDEARAALKEAERRALNAEVRESEKRMAAEAAEHHAEAAEAKLETARAALDEALAFMDGEDIVGSLPDQLRQALAALAR